ncbi:DUF853 domain-containing protein [Streptomyces sp. LX-29]|uniref:helicase HerA-like domain-containing protein n=1 Tax=Streptomyces sp. LX-29 TaxID=2900152 RepID=UPI00240E447E|nr:helicase HerA-like domain-containing protein [Streptomyces sp. LX-29]WFB08303.1 DUF853 domain-containing protein [Streptomyces sp. LX-29]
MNESPPSATERSPRAPWEDVPRRIAEAYLCSGPALDLGALLWDGGCRADAPIRVPLSVLNRHGLVAGAPGSGRTTTLQLIAEQLSEAGVPVFLSDVEGDVSGIAAPGAGGERVARRAAEVGQEWSPGGFPAVFYALGGIGPGVPLRATVTDFGPLLLARALGLDRTEERSLELIFHYADAEGLELIELRDLRAVVAFLVSDEGKTELKAVGGLSAATAGVVLRTLTAFEREGAGAFFGEPEFDTAELLCTAPDGRGVVSVLRPPAGQDRPRLFSTFLMWLLADLFHELPEVGDVDRPKLVFFFAAARPLFDDASAGFLESITRTVRLLRSRGVGIYFVTRAAGDVPAEVLGQLGNRVQHALSALTPDEATALKATVRTFPETAYDLEGLLTGLGTGEAVVTVVSERGAPTPVAAVRLRAPRSRMGPIEPAELERAVTGSVLFERYAQAVDRDAAYEKLAAVEAAKETGAAGAAAASAGPGTGAGGGERRARRDREPRFEPETLVDQVVGGGIRTTLARSVATRRGGEISRSLCGTARRRGR